MIKKVKNTVLWAYVINNLNGEEIVGTFYKKEFQKQTEKSLEMKRKVENLYVKWKGCNNLFNR